LYVFAYGAPQGLLLCLLPLFNRRGRILANVLLSVLMLALTIHIVNSFLIATGAISRAPAFLYIALLLAPAVGPLYYYYTRCLLVPDYRPRPWVATALIVIPGLLWAAWILIDPPATAGNVDDVMAARDGSPQRFVSAVELWPHFALLGYLGAFLVLTLRFIKRIGKEIRAHFSDTAARHMIWLRILGAGLSVYIAIFAVGLVKMAVTREFTIADHYRLSLLRILVIQFTAIAVFFLPEAFTTTMRDLAIKRRKIVDESKAEEYLGRLRRYMKTEKPYRNEDLRLPDLALALSMSPHALSQLLNDHLDTSFPDFINRYRAEEVQKRLEDGESDRYTLLAIANEVGFSSKTSLYRAFKKFFGISPSDYRKQLRESG
jgi:AraC-like DNA-binding protein